MENYLCSLHVGDKVDARVVYRVVGLWFENSSDERVCRLIQNAFGLKAERPIPTAVLVPLIYQLVARLGDGEVRLFSFVVRYILTNRLALTYVFPAFFI